MSRLASALLVTLFLAACTSSPPTTTQLSSEAPSTAPLVTPGVDATSTPARPSSPIATATAKLATASPTAPPTPAFTPTANTPFNGVWASSPVKRDDMLVALQKHAIDTSQLDQWFGDWDQIPYRIFEMSIDSGRLTEYEIGENVILGEGWAGDLALVNDHSIVAQDDVFACPVTYDLARTANDMTVKIAADACTDPTDLPIQTAIYESAPFHLVQAADWTPTPVPTSTPPTGSVAPHTPMISTSSMRQTFHAIGTVPGASLGFMEYLPVGYGDEPRPLIVSLHGSGESGDGSDYGVHAIVGSGIPDLIYQDQWPDDRPFVVLAPQHEEVPPSYCMESAEIDTFIRFAIANYNVDPKRVYVTGLSCGAMGLWDYLGEHTDELVAAAIPIAGYGIGAAETAGCDLGRVPIWAFHGLLDENVPVRGDVYPLSVIKSCPGVNPDDAQMTVYPDLTHNVWTTTYNEWTGLDIYSWLLSHHK